MGLERPSARKAVELDECIDRLLATGRWAEGLPHGKARAEIDSLVHVARLLLALTHLVTQPRPLGQHRPRASTMNTRKLRRATPTCHQGSCTRPRLGPA